MTWVRRSFGKQKGLRQMTDALPAIVRVRELFGLVLDLHTAITVEVFV